MLIVCAVISVAGKAVKFPNKYDLKQSFCAILDQMLKLRSIGGFGRQCAVNMPSRNARSRIPSFFI